MPRLPRRGTGLLALATLSTLPIVLLSIALACADERAACEAGFALHLTKPVDPEFLLKVLEQLVPTH